MSIKSECRYFLSDRPCQFHKEKGAKCGSCQFYVKKGKKILLIKLGSLGDVLRTTFIAKGLKEKYKNAHICWLTEPECVPLLERNSYIDRIFPYGLSSYAQLHIAEFDLLINLDIDTQSASLATLIKAKEKIGFGMDKNGRIVAFNPQAKEWLKMSLWDDLKKKNKKTYQELIFRPANSGLDERFAGLDFVVDSGAHADIRKFASLINIIDVLVSADTFALHVALAFGKKAVILFGPTSAQEVDVFGNGEKVVAPMDCVGCYHNNCSKTPNCLEKISPDSVFAAIKRVFNYV